MRGKKTQVDDPQRFLSLSTVDPSENPFWTRSKSGATLALLVFSVLGALLASAIAVPPSLVATGTVEKGVEWWDSLPSALSDVVLPERGYMTDNNGKRIATFYGEDRVTIPFKEMGDNPINALIATEDSRFWEHVGLDAKGVARALVNNVLGDSTQGASTLTQQLVENIRLRSAEEEERQGAKTQTVTDKVEELRYALAVEETHSKEEIVEKYLNVVYLGNNAYGIEAAAQRYFSVSAKELTVPQAATLIAMLKSPTAYDPISRPEQSRTRRDVVMKRMVETEYITQEQYEKWIKKPTKLKEKITKRGCGASTHPFYCQMVLNTINSSKEFGETKEDRETFVQNGGWVIKTAMDRETMRLMQESVDRGLGRSNQYAVSSVLVEPGTGEVKGMAQNRSWGVPKNDRDYEHTQIVYADSPHIQVGSTFKAIPAVAAIEEGYSPTAKLQASSPMYFDGFDSPAGGFKNDSGSYGAVDMRTAFKHSINTYFVNLTSQVGVKDVAAMARRLGMTSVPSNLSGREGSIALGSYETSPLQLATVYASMAARGVVCNPITILSAKTVGTKESIRVPNANCHQEVAPAVMDTVSEIMQAPFEAGGTATRVAIDRKATGKTGTTQEHAAVLFAGYTPQAATAVWVGDPRGGFKYPVRNIYANGGVHYTSWGGTVPGPMWQRIMLNYHKGKKKQWYPKPGGVSAAMSSRVVPDVRGMELNAAVTILLKAGFKVEVAPKTAKQQENVAVSPNYVVNQTPKSGGKMAYGDKITLTLSAGSDVNSIIPETYQDMQLEQQNKNKGVTQ